MSTTTFASLGLSAATLAALDKAGYQNPTPVQHGAIPPALAGHNVIGCAATGTGKTAAFMLPLIERAAGRRGTTALVLAPTRELAQQIAEYVDTFGPARGVKAAVVVGGLGMGPQASALRERRHLVIATPGRLIDHIDQGNADLSGVEALVLDEADRMLDMGFRPQLERILSRLSRRKQTLLFSATMAGEVATFAKRYVPDPVKIEIHRSGTTAERAEQKIFHVERHEKPALLLALLGEDDDSTLIFVRTKHRADKIYKFLNGAGVNATRLHGDRSQSQRRHSLDGFKAGTYRVLVATDVAARGIDVEQIGHVVNFDLPGEPQDYVHRIGRTARNAASGRATSFAEPDDRAELQAIEKLVGKQLPRGVIPRENPAFVAELERRKSQERDPGVHGGRTRAQLGLPPQEPESQSPRAGKPRGARQSYRPQRGPAPKSHERQQQGAAGGQGGGGRPPARSGARPAGGGGGGGRPGGARAGGGGRPGGRPGGGRPGGGAGRRGAAGRGR
ncbi:DEAD/DEAH box helicase [Vulgatibacter sp.]|uniref:DEAD/DEAH box helicase n=1 Tax=Vulgatibacter sp. TaxID=1971226 RepID=UPI003567060C